MPGIVLDAGKPGNFRKSLYLLGKGANVMKQREKGRVTGKCLLLLEEDTLEGKEGSPGERRLVLRL